MCYVQGMQISHGENNFYIKKEIIIICCVIASFPFLRKVRVDGAVLPAA